MSGETVLVIDDSPTILKVVQLVLTKAGYNVITAADGDEGIEAARQTSPDLILLDFVMPKMNGYQVCQALHAEEALKHVPVVLMSAKGDQVGERFVKVMGIVDYITKPFSPDAVTGVVQHTLKKHRQSALPGSAGAEASGLLPDISPEAAADAARAAQDARRAALSTLRDGLSRAASRAVVLGALDRGISLDEQDALAWIARGLTGAVLEVLLGELRAAAPELTGTSDPALAGDVRNVPIAEVLLLLAQQEQTGVLVVTQGSAQVELHFASGHIALGTATGVPEEFLLGRFLLATGSLTREDLDRFVNEHRANIRLLGSELVREGLVPEAELKEALRLQTSELVYELLRWKYGKFSFHATSEPSPVAIDASLGLSVEGILMEGFRRVDEWHLIEREINDFELVLLRNEDAVTRMGRGRLTREELAILELVNGKNTVKEIIRQSRMGSFEVSKMLYRLLSIKLVRKRVQPVAV